MINPSRQSVEEFCSNANKTIRCRRAEVHRGFMCVKFLRSHTHDLEGNF